MSTADELFSGIGLFSWVQVPFFGFPIKRDHLHFANEYTLIRLGAALKTEASEKIVAGLIIITHCYRLVFSRQETILHIVSLKYLESAKPEINGGKEK